MHSDNMKPAFSTNKNAVPVPNEENLVVALDILGVTLWKDIFADRVWLGEHQITDDLERELRVRVRKEFQLAYSPTAFHDAVNYVAYANRRHPLRERLEGLVWDGTERIETFLIDHAGAEDSTYVRTVSRLWFLAGARRILEPGVKFDELVILESPQGGLKSSAMERLALKPEWFTDGMPLGGDSKLAIEQAQGKWIVEFADMHGKSREDDRLKAFLSRTTDRARLAYDRRAADVPRSWIPIGTTNNSNYLKDPTGNRRFWPVQVGVFSLGFDPEQLWAEATARRDESIRMPKEVWALAGEQQEARVQEDPWAESIEDYVRDAEVVPAGDIWAVVGLGDIDRRTQRDNSRLGAIMRRLGFKPMKRRRDGTVTRCYVRGEGILWREPSEIPI